jgi:V/A-type H+-transporting ATPase subunit E
MALADLLQAIEADVAAERARADRETAAEAKAIVEQARERAGALEAELAAAPESQAREEAEQALALARLDVSRAAASARDEAFVSVVTGVRAKLAGLRETGAYPNLFRALLAEARAALPEARVVRVDRRDVELATPLAGGLRLVPTLETWGGVELVSDDGRTVRNTVEERLANAELLLRRRFAQRLATASSGVTSAAAISSTGPSQPRRPTPCASSSQAPPAHSGSRSYRS